MQAFILRRNIARFKELLSQEEHERERYMLQGLLANVSGACHSRGRYRRFER